MIRPRSTTSPHTSAKSDDCTVSRGGDRRGGTVTPTRAIESGDSGVRCGWLVGEEFGEATDFLVDLVGERC